MTFWCQKIRTSSKEQYLTQTHSHYPSKQIRMLFFKKISFVLLAVLLGVAMAWFNPVQPKQVEQAAAPAFKTQQLLDNEDIPLDNNIHNSRKCRCHVGCWWSYGVFLLFNPLSPPLFSLLIVVFRWLLHGSKSCPAIGQATSPMRTRTRPSPIIVSLSTPQ